MKLKYALLIVIILWNIISFILFLRNTPTLPDGTNSYLSIVSSPYQMNWTMILLPLVFLGFYIVAFVIHMKE